jgi:hypothetical protein
VTTGAVTAAFRVILSALRETLSLRSASSLVSHPKHWGKVFAATSPGLCNQGPSQVAIAILIIGSINFLPFHPESFASHPIVLPKSHARSAVMAKSAKGNWSPFNFQTMLSILPAWTGNENSST